MTRSNDVDSRSRLGRRKGGCHCGRIRFEIEAREPLVAYACNCSMCHRVGFVHLIVEGDAFRLTEGEDLLSTYTFNTGTAKHFFCSVCGVKSFYVPRSHPDGYSVNVRCLDDVDLGDVRIEPFDGQNWEANVDDLR